MRWLLEPCPVAKRPLPVPAQNLVSLERVGLSPPLFGRFEVCGSVRAGATMSPAMAISGTHSNPIQYNTIPFQNGFCYGYLRGEPLDTAGMRYSTVLLGWGWVCGTNGLCLC
jgi:hypothetical protein